MSVIGYLIAIGTIDNSGTGDAHTVGAVFFFIILFILIMLKTILIIKMRNWDTTFMGRNSYISKLLLGVYLLSVWIYCLIGLIFELFKNDDNIYIVIV